MTEFVGRSGHRALFSDSDRTLGVVIDSQVAVIVATGAFSDFDALGPWDGGEFNETDYRLADGYLSSDHSTPEPTGRRYTVPKGVQRAAQRAKTVTKTSAVTRYVGTLLAAGGQITFNELATINTFWQNPVEYDEAFYGGKSAEKWSGTIVAREGITASAAPLAQDFQTLLAENPEAGPEFLVRVDTGSGDIDRLYRIDIDKRTYVWDSASWADLGQTEWNIWDYDRALDTEESSATYSHILIDPESAIRTAHLFHEFGNVSITVDDINPLESTLVRESLTDVDWGHIDTVLTAAGTNPSDGIYSEEERSDNASKQVRDATGKFATTGTRVMVGGNAQQTGTITRVNPNDGTVEVGLEQGGSVVVPGNTVEAVKTTTQTIPGKPIEIPRVDFSGILAEPRSPRGSLAQLPGTLPALTSQDLQAIVNNFPEWVAKQRGAFKPVASPGGVTVKDKNSLDSTSRVEKDTGRTLETDATTHPLLAEYLSKTKNKIYYQPITASGEPSTGVVVVLLPIESNTIHGASSEDIPHLTAVYLGGVNDVTVDEYDNILEQLLGYAANATPITVPVKERGELGDDKADVLFLDATDALTAFRDGMIEEGSPVWAQYSSIEQFPKWLPHVTLGYPETPAKGTPSEEPITFDRLGFWYGENRIEIPLGAPALVAAAEAEPAPMTPDTSDVQPVYMAVVSPDDTRAVFDLISLVPTNATSTAPSVYRREEGKWSRDDQMLINLRSATPPPVVPLDDEMLDDVLIQVDRAQNGEAEESDPVDVAVATEPDPVTASADFDLQVLWGPRDDFMFEALVAAGGADKNRGGAEKLRRYWLHGKGALKIRWGTPGDWTRCVRNLSKYMGPRARGYCALRHHEATGMWTGDKRHRQMFANNTPLRVVSTNLIKSIDVVQDERIAYARRNAFAVDSRNIEYDTTTPEGLTAAAGAVQFVEPIGGAFFIPLAIPEGVESGDGRKIVEKVVGIRELPISLLWQIQTDDGHSGSVVVGRIDKLGRTPNGVGGGFGHFDTGVYGREAERMVRAGMLRFVSADLDNFEAEQQELAAEDGGKIGKSKLIIHKARVMAVTIVAKPAFQECTIEMVPELMIEDPDSLADGIYADEPDPVDAMALVAAGYIADAVPVVPPRSWYNNPELTGPTPLSVDDDGRVYGHVAVFNTPHISPNLRGIDPPRSKSGYAYFNTGILRTDDGSDVHVGQLTLAGGHADLHFSAREAVKHYDDTASAVADVHAGEDEFGIWVAGGLRPGVSPQQVRVFRASAPSGDWRPIRGNLELVAVCQVNVPGFPQARSLVASGHTMAITAAGAAPLVHMTPDPLTMIAGRLAALEQRHEMALTDQFAPRVSELLASTMASREAVNASLAIKAEAALERMQSFGYVAKKSRDEAATKGQALPDGSYPIRNIADLKNAIQAYGRAKESERAKVRRHIIKRARALGQYTLVPEDWKNADQASLDATIESMRTRAEAARAEFAAVTAAAAPAKVAAPAPAVYTPEESKKLEDMTEAEKQSLVNKLRSRGEDIPEELADPKVQGTDSEEQSKYKPGYQPRDYNGRFRLVLARLKENMGNSGNQEIVKDIEATDSQIRAGDYSASVRAGVDLKSKLDRLDEGALNSESIGNVRATAKDLATAIANLPLPFKNQAQKVRYSDLPPTLRDLMEDMVDRVTEKIGSKEGAAATANIRSLMSGADMYSQGEISREMSKLLRLLT